MDPTFSIQIDHSTSLVQISMQGFFLPADIDRMMTEVRTAYLGLKCRKNEHLTVVDIRQMAIQPQDSVEAFSRMIADPRTAAARIAFVVARSLSRLQVKRAANGRPAEFFEAPEEALAWLLERST